MAEKFAGENSDVNITVGSSGTGGGFERFCAGETDISDASRAIDEEEVAACEKGGIEYQEFRSVRRITNVTSAQADVGGDNLTMEQLKAIWGPDSKIDNWANIPDGDFQDAPLSLAGPDSQSGTYDFFNEEVLGEDAEGEVIEPRQDYTASADDNVIVRAVQSAPSALGYFGFTYYEENADTLKLFKVDGVEPTPETITFRRVSALQAAVHLREEPIARSRRGQGFRLLLPRERDHSRRGAAVRDGATVGDRRVDREGGLLS